MEEEIELNGPGDTFQGPHNWRKALKPVQSPVKEQLPNVFHTDDGAINEKNEQESNNRRVQRKRSKDERLEGNKIRERVKHMTGARRETGSSEKNRGSVLSGNMSPLFHKRRQGVGASLRSAESAFTRLVVNKPTSPGVPHRKVTNASSTRIPVPSSLRPSVIIRKTSFNTSDNPMHNTEAWKRRVDRVKKARLYLLQQMGPNSFLIGGDSPDHKYRVIIGPQRCSCGRSPHCVHILFVMLRVFQIPENDLCLASRTLKNFEVEALFRNYHARRTLKLQDTSAKKKKKSKQKLTDPTETDSQTEVMTSSTGDIEAPHNSEEDEEAESLVKEEEDTCPICLLEMVEGESLTECLNGCNNKLHHHCIAIWFEGCRTQHEPLTCPICRASWKLQDGEKSEEVVEETLPVPPPNTRASSPVPPPDSDSVLPHAEPIPSEHMHTAQAWIPVFGEEIVSCLYSKNWNRREIGLKHLGRVAHGAMLLGVGAGRAGAVLSPSRQASVHTMLQCTCSILAFMCADPVYKVFVAGLRTLRTLLAYTPCRDESQQASLHAFMKPVVETILLKCADSNKRTSQLSISALAELVKGQEGELSVGKEISNPGTRGLGGVGYLMKCITQEYQTDTVQWQWLLGRFYVIDDLLENHPTKFVILPLNDCNEGNVSPRQSYRHYNRVFNLLKFALLSMSFSHRKVSKMSRRVFYITAKLQVHLQDVFKDVLELLDGAELSVRKYMKQKLIQFMEDSRLTRQVKVTSEDDVRLRLDVEDPPVSTPSLSATSTPRCTSPVCPTSPRSTLHTSYQLSVVPEVPPNSPNVKSRLKSAASRISASSEFLDNSRTNHSRDHVQSSSLTKHSSLPALQTFSFENLSFRCSSCDRESSPMPAHQAANYTTSPTLQLTSVGHTTHPLISPNTNAHNTSLTSCSPTQRDCACQTEPQPIRPDTLFKFPLEAIYAEDKGVQTPDSLSEVDDLDLQIPPAEEEAEQNEGSCLNLAEGVSLTEDLSDLTLSPSTSAEKISFKTEVASSPQSGSSAGSTSEGNCPCKEEVEREEAEALAEALHRSEIKQEALPHVPGLSQATDATDAITIHQDGDMPHQYEEGQHWVRGVMLGTGAFSTCYQARDIKTGTIMAVKQISFCRNSCSEQEQVIEAVNEEIDLMSRLNHPNIVRILGATQQGYHFFMFVEWMPGGSVATLLDKYGVFTEQVITSYTQQVLRGLAYLHDNHMLHRDLKGANLLVDSTGQRVRIGDFGASARLASRSTGAGEFQGQLLGTIAFMAPEVLRGESYGRSCDIWGVGCTVIEMATARPPWGANDISNHLALIFRIASSENPPPIPETVSPPVKDLLLRCLENNRHDRPPAKELLKHPLFTMAHRF